MGKENEKFRQAQAQALQEKGTSQLEKNLVGGLGNQLFPPDQEPPVPIELRLLATDQFAPPDA